MKTEQTIPRELDYKDVKFTARVSRNDNCTCDSCHRIGRVIKITTPETKHFNGGELRTIYTQSWFCDGCMELLKEAINNPAQEAWNRMYTRKDGDEP